jgi:hypothetical protein
VTDTIACDVSYYQREVDNTYPHGWLIFRACDGTFRDSKYKANLSWAEHAALTGKLTGFTAYVVFRPGVDVLSVIKSMTASPSRFMTVMIDIESWQGQIRGDYSAAITKLATDLAGWLGDKRRVLAYGNQGDLANIYPRRPDWLKLVVAGYGSQRPSVHNMIGWQYSDGSSRWPVPSGYPRSSKPFGNCDHNVFPGYSPAQLAAALGVGDHSTDSGSVHPEDKDWFDMATKADLREVIREELNKGAAGPLGSVRPFWYFVAHPILVRRNEAQAKRAAKKGKK